MPEARALLQAARRRARAAAWRTLPRPALAAWLRAALGEGDRGWAFVLGCNNSGTTLLAHLLGDHPELRPLAMEGVKATDARPKVPEALGRVFSERLSAMRLVEDSLDVRGGDSARLPPAGECVEVGSATP